MYVFGVILVPIFRHSDWIRENADQNNSEYGHFFRSASLSLSASFFLFFSCFITTVSNHSNDIILFLIIDSPNVKFCFFIWEKTQVYCRQESLNIEYWSFKVEMRKVQILNIFWISKIMQEKKVLSSIICTARGSKFF